LGVPVVSNFRAADLAAGGEGAPLATLFHVEVFGRSGEFVCVQNLGGISNVTAIDGRRGAARVLAFDTGPANVLLDLAMRRLTDGRRLMDGEGAWASRGTADERLLAEWLQHPFLRRRPPKSTGRELFGESFWVQAFKQAQEAAVSRFGLLATLAEFTARSITLNYQWHLGGVPDRVVLTGGGAANPDLVARITRELRTWEPGIHVCDSQDLGWPRQAIEPAAFALLAYRRMAGLPGNLPKTTGARRPVLLGQVTEV
jgi:anhydro-N-acetylmuramic acid kinase